MVRSYEGINSVPKPLTLLVGNYSVVVTAGESVPASFDKKFYKGTETFAIIKNDPTTVTVKCNIANTLANVIFDTETLDKVFTDYKVTISVPDGSLEYTTENNELGYYILGDDSKLTCLFEGTTINETSYELTSNIDAKESTQYNITYRYKTTAMVDGVLDLYIDETTLHEEESEVIIAILPVFIL